MGDVTVRGDTRRHQPRPVSSSPTSSDDDNEPKSTTLHRSPNYEPI
ncbi:hypothetical protein [Haloprofundus halophilus]|nr:hypothetical protein [Haloprofundus halophilus]